jgi:hypothetical protein
MRPLRTAVIATMLVAAPAVTVAVATGPAAAHKHPTPVELVAPAVVRVETYGEVSISLIEHNMKGAHIGLLQRRYTPQLAAGSGFAVDPTGGVVTSPEVTDVDLRRAEIYAANQIFHERYGDAAAPLPADPFTMHQIPGGAPSDQIAGRLQRCYRPNTTDSTGGCVVFSQRMVKVLPFVTSQKQYGDLQATVLAPPEGQPGDVVVLKVGASSMPTARIADSVQGAPFAVLGFSTPPSDERSLRKLEGHFTGDNTPALLHDTFYNTIVNNMDVGFAGGPVVGERGEVVGFLVRRPGGSPSDLSLVDPAAIRAALGTAKIAPHSGPTDSAYESALHNYKNKLYTAAIPSLAQTVKLYPGHALATEALTQATRKKGTAEDLTGRAPQAAPAPANDPMDFWRTVLLIAIAVIVLIALAVAIVLLRRRRRRSTPKAAAGPPPVVMPGPRQSSSPASGAGRVHRQATVLRRPVVASASGVTPAADRAADCPVCDTPAVAGQTFCGQCGQRLG